MRTIITAVIAAVIASVITVYAQTVTQTLTAFSAAPPGGTATLPLAGTETVLIIQGGALKTVAVSQLPNQIANVVVQGTVTAGDCVSFVSARTIQDSGGGCLLAK